MLSRRNLPLVLLLAAVCVVYGNSFGNSFHFDDFHTITDNPAVRSLGNARRIFTDTTAFSVLPANQTYRPVVTLSLALDYALGHGYVPFWFHLSTTVWFLLLVTVLFHWSELLFERSEPAGANRWLALGAAAWFGLHPAMAETVNYIIQRGDLYCTLGCVGALLVYARWKHLRRYGIYLLPFAVAMLSKPPAAVFPVLLFLYVFFFEAKTGALRSRWRSSVRACLPAMVVTGGLLLLQSRMTPKSYLPSILPVWSYRLTQPFVWLRYVGALFLPVHLNVDTDLQAFSRLNGEAVAGLVFVLVLGAAIVSASRRRRMYPIAFGLLWFVVTQLPTSLYALSEVENDHRMFFSFPGLIVAVIWTLHLAYGGLQARLARSGRVAARLRVVVIAVAAMCLGGYAYGAHRRNEVWRTEDTLWADDVAKSPRNGRGLMNYGLTRMNAGDLDGALVLFERAHTFLPNYPTLEINLGVVTGQIAARRDPALRGVAEDHFKRAIALAPNDDLPHAFYGRWLLGQGRLPEAVGQLESAVVLNPQRAMQRDLLLTAYETAGNRDAAQRLAQSTLTVVPEDPVALGVLRGEGSDRVAALVNASLAAYRAGQFEQSIEAARKAVEIDPNSAEAWNNIAAGNAALQRWDEAVAAAEKAVALRPDFQLAKNNLQWALQGKVSGGTR